MTASIRPTSELIERARQALEASLDVGTVEAGLRSLGASRSAAKRAIHAAKAEMVACPLQVSYDAARDVLVVDGVRFVGSLFRALLGPTPPDQALQVVRVDGRVTIRQFKLPPGFRPDGQGEAPSDG